MKFLSLLPLLALCASASPLHAPFRRAFHPVVLWHGLGDSAYSEGMLSLAASLRDAFPGIFVHLVHLADDLAADQRAGFFGDTTQQVNAACEQLKQVKELQGGFDAVGFSQGGQLLRAVVQRCEGVQVRNLVTFGSQHMGISDFPACKPADLLCRLAEGALRGGVYSDYAQTHLVSAQYYRDPTSVAGYARYLATNHFIADINNERERKGEYKERMQALESFVMLMFDKDITVEPKQSSWFASYPLANASSSSSSSSSFEHDPALEPTPLRQSVIYTEDRLGLQSIDKRGGLLLELCRGVHMQIDEACQRLVFGKYIGTSPPSRLLPGALRRRWARALYATLGLRGAALPTEAHAALLLALAALLQALVVCAAAVRRRMFGAIRLA